MKQSLTKKEAMRVEIVQDALKWIKPSKVVAHNAYVKTDKLTCFIASDENSKTLAKKLQKTCEVCAKGALLLSAVALYNYFDFGWLTRGCAYSMTNGILMDRLIGIFSEAQLALIELAFETRPLIGYTPGLFEYDSTARFKAAKLGSQYKKDIDRLRAILNNMVANKGTFKP